MLARYMMIPAMTTPRETAAKVVLTPISRKLAAMAPVHAPVPGRGPVFLLAVGGDIPAQPGFQLLSVQWRSPLKSFFSF